MLFRSLPDLQPGSSIMPGKVNPVIPEAVTMVCAQVMGNDVTIAIGGQSGNFQLNVMLPVIAFNLLQSVTLLGRAASLLADKAIAGFTVNEARLADLVGRNPILVTALNPVAAQSDCQGPLDTWHTASSRRSQAARRSSF